MLGPPGGSVFASPPKPWQRLTFAVNPETGYGIPMTRGSGFGLAMEGAFVECLGLLDVLLHHDLGGRLGFVLGAHQQSRTANTLSML
eukprot:Skav228953  [mRNA]  locus=scaffold3820:77966:78646:- [translate_table: standard]